MKILPRILAAVALLFTLAAAQALEIRPYSAAALKTAQDAGQPVALHFHADWCPTCRAQTKVFEALKADPKLPLTLLVADYDQERELKRQLGVRTQSTLVVYRGTKETARLAGNTDAATLQKALHSAVGM